ncbi:glucosidase 2 subunit beta isoform X1 [Hyalella azteca]|uniref:Glucosidase 2 subunit beta n=1 Tax=Hyalella azteca TaxID=294128 RepID=A0A8B7P5S9_HYAAZ|nr:glucosidase 2 subunit beta isoform X1 [Hyalella azteca]
MVQLIQDCLRLLLVSFLLSCSLGSEVLRPRGVSLIKASLYDPARDFSCLDGSGTIPFRNVNDDYCDCRDGSDEPGTSACPNGFFHCSNKGHIPLDVRSSRVNDGICDCCDASDEWASGADCTDQCQEFGRAAREEALRKEEESKKGYSLKLGMIEQGKNMKQERKEKIALIELELQQAESVRAEQETLKLAAEELESAALEQYKEANEAKKAAEDAIKLAASEAEAKEAFGELDTDGDGAVTKQEVQADTTYDTNRDGSVSDDEATFYMQHADSLDFHEFFTKSWHLMRPAYHVAKNKAGAPPPSLFTPPSTTPPPPPPPHSEEKSVDDEGEDESLLDDDEENPEDEDDYDPELDNVDEGLLDEPTEVPDVVYDDETQGLVDAANAARSSYQDAQRSVDALKKQLSEEQASLDKDFGPEDEFRVFEGRCFEYTDREYTYKLCPFDTASQIPKNGGGETRLGTWHDWEGEDTGPRGKYSAMKYTNGQGCWNGPNRSTLVHLRCGVENELISAAEPSKCEYVFIFTTPAACDAVEDGSDEHAQHTEL